MVVGRDGAVVLEINFLLPPPQCDDTIIEGGFLSVERVVRYLS